MSFAKSAPASVLKRFPELLQVVTEQYRTNDDFRELVDHFDECERVLTHLMSDRSSNRIRIDEYQAVLVELREEIAMALSALAKQI